MWDFKYDAGDRLRKVERAGHEVTVQDWDGQGRLAAIHTLFNGTETRAWGFDADGLDVEVRDSTALSIMSDDRRRGTLELAGKMTARAR